MKCMVMAIHPKTKTREKAALVTYGLPPGRGVIHFADGTDSNQEDIDYQHFTQDITDADYKQPDIHNTSVLNDREKTHGCYKKTAALAQQFKTIVNHCDGGLLSDVQAESLDMICTKISRILSGNPSEPDHWRDIAGYATLVVESLENG